MCTLRKCRGAFAVGSPEGARSPSARGACTTIPTIVNPSDIVAKTAAGVDELRTRARKLPQRLRAVLILVDGVRTAADVRHAASGLGLPEGFLESLERDGLIEARAGSPAPARPASTGTSQSGEHSRPAPLGSVDIETGPPATAPRPPSHPPGSPGARGEEETNRFTAAKQFMYDVAVDALGLRGFFFTMKIEQCFSRADLQGLLGEFERTIAKSRGIEAARAAGTRARELLR